MNAHSLLEQNFLEVRCKLLDIGAALDRMERAPGAAEISSDPRWKQIAEGIALLSRPGTDRAEQIQQLFSDAYEAGWSAR